MPIRIESEIYAVGLNMISVILGEHKEFVHPVKIKGDDFGDEEE